MLIYMELKPNFSGTSVCNIVPVPEISTGIPVPDSRGKRDAKNREKNVPAGL